nr:hypothetical protein [Allomuricauda sp.]
MKYIRFVRRIISLGFIFLLMGCFSIETKNPRKAYKYWLGSNPPKEIELIKGEYYQSPHFTLEYELFLKFKSEKKWFDELVELNGLEIDTIGNTWSLWTEFPEWFDPGEGYLIYAKNQMDKFDRSRYFRNPKTGICYVYETLGM